MHACAERVGIRAGAAADDLTRDAHDDRSRRNGFHDNGIRSDLAIIADRDRAQYLRPGADGDPVADCGMPFAGVEASAAERDTVVDGYVIADFRGLTDDDTRRMVDEQPGTDGRRGMDLDTRQHPGYFGDKSCGQLRVSVPKATADPVAPDRVHAGVAEDDLNGRPRCRIPLPHYPYVAANPGKDCPKGHELIGQV
jgi:hypothetical protein